MTEFKSFREGAQRPPTWAERERLEWAREQGVADVFVEPSDAPDAFWVSVLQATHWCLASDALTDTWRAWGQEFSWAEGVTLHYQPQVTYAQVVKLGALVVQEGEFDVQVGMRLSAIELLLDVVDDQGDSGFRDRVNDRARHYRVGLRLEGNRFVPVTSEHVHQDVVQPALILLSSDRFKDIDGLYRKAFDRALSGDPAGAVTAATTTVEEMFRLGLGVPKGDLGSLTKDARQTGWISPAVQQLLVKLSALRDESDAHKKGTDDFETAMLALHLTASVLLYLGRRGPFQEGS